MTTQEIIHTVTKDGGITLNHNLEPITYESGFQVSLPHTETIFDFELLDQVHFVDAVLKAYRSFEYMAENKSIGLWRSDNKVYVDLSLHIDSVTIAKTLGHEWEQKAIFDWANKESIPVDAP